MPPSAPDIIIRVENLTTAYEGLVILDRVSFEVRRGEIFAILGSSGCGKTTLMRHMIGLYKPTAGRILIEGRDFVDCDEAQRAALLRRIGVMYQSGALFGSMTLHENVRLPLEEHTRLPREAMDLIVEMKLRQVGLGGFGERLPTELSGGMQKRAAIARAMALDSPIVFLDEPSGGLDPITSAGLDALIIRLSRTLGVTFVVITHELPSIHAIVDRAIMLDASVRGILATGSPAQLRDESDIPLVRRFFARQTESETAP